MPESQYMSEGRYLPRFLRDFHDQKDVFKWIGRAVLRAKKVGDVDHYDVNWMNAQVYVIDKFLWFMARHGYTLQPTRAKYPTADWSASIAEMKAEDTAAFKAMISGWRT